jgi:hypothetical protein
LDGPPLCFDGYSVHFEKHDEGVNTHALDLDREVWLLLLGYPLDACSTSAIAKVVSGFSLLHHIHESNVMSRVIIKVCMHAESQVPPSVTIGVGDDSKVKTWTVPMYILSATNVTTLGDEDAYLPDGPLHPLPHHAAPCMGLRRDCTCMGQSFIAENDDAVGAAHQNAPPLGLEAQNSGSQLSPAAQDFQASGGLLLEVEGTPEVQVQMPARGPVLFPAPPQPASPPPVKVVSLSPFLGSALSLCNRINPSYVSGLDLSLDLVIPPYLSLTTMIDILNLIRDDDNMIQGASKSLLLECLENLENIDDSNQQCP